MEYLTKFKKIIRKLQTLLFSYNKQALILSPRRQTITSLSASKLAGTVLKDSYYFTAPAYEMYNQLACFSLWPVKQIDVLQNTLDTFRRFYGAIFYNGMDFSADKPFLPSDSWMQFPLNIYARTFSYYEQCWKDVMDGILSGAAQYHSQLAYFTLSPVFLIAWKIPASTDYGK